MIEEEHGPYYYTDSLCEMYTAQRPAFSFWDFWEAALNAVIHDTSCQAGLARASMANGPGECADVRMAERFIGVPVWYSCFRLFLFERENLWTCLWWLYDMLRTG